LLQRGGQRAAREAPTALLVAAPVADDDERHEGRRLPAQAGRSLLATGPLRSRGQQLDQPAQLDAPLLALTDARLHLADDPYGVLGRHAGALHGLDQRAAAVREVLVAAVDLQVAGAPGLGVRHQLWNGSSSRPSITSKRLRIT